MCVLRSIREMIFTNPDMGIYTRQIILHNAHLIYGLWVKIMWCNRRVIVNKYTVFSSFQFTYVNRQLMIHPEIYSAYHDLPSPTQIVFMIK